MKAESVILQQPIPPRSSLLRQLLFLALPVIAEQLCHMVVGIVDTWLANNWRTDKAAAATTAVGNVSYFLWFIGLIVAAIGTGSTALIARAKGARHRRLANSVTGQSIVAAAVLGAALSLVLYFAGPALIELTRLEGDARAFALSYLRLLTISLPFSTVMFVANACLRGAGDTFTPAIAMILVDVVNAVVSYALTFGRLGLPEMGFEGIAIGTVIAYIVGGVLQFGVLVSGRGALKLHLHRMRPHWQTMKRVLRIGIPSGMEGLLTWIAQFTVIIVINKLDANHLAAAAHINAVRIESLSYLPGFGFAVAATTLVGQALGRKDPAGAKNSTYLAYAIGGGMMTLLGVAFILFGDTMSRWMLPDQPQIAALCARCLFITGWIQSGFAASMIFSGALRGAGDTMAVMIINLASTIGLRLAGVLVAVYVLGGGLAPVWCVLAGELFIRGCMVWTRFAQGTWKHLEV